MKTILHLSILLMLLAGAAGALNFLKMFRNGEIDKIYEREESATRVSVTDQMPGTSISKFSSAAPVGNSGLSEQTSKPAVIKKKYSNLSTLLQMHSPVAIRKEVEVTPISLLESQEISSINSGIDVPKRVAAKKLARQTFRFSEFSRGPLIREDMVKLDNATTSDTAGLISVSTEKIDP